MREKKYLREKVFIPIANNWPFTSILIGKKYWVSALTTDIS